MSWMDSQYLPGAAQDGSKVGVSKLGNFKTCELQLPEFLNWLKNSGNQNPQVNGSFPNLPLSAFPLLCIREMGRGQLQVLCWRHTHTHTSILYSNHLMKPSFALVPRHSAPSILSFSFCVQLFLRFSCIPPHLASL